jgi:hypothetical protein
LSRPRQLGTPESAGAAAPHTDASFVRLKKALTQAAAAGEFDKDMDGDDESDGEDAPADAKAMTDIHGNLDDLYGHVKRYHDQLESVTARHYQCGWPVHRTACVARDRRRRSHRSPRKL